MNLIRFVLAIGAALSLSACATVQQKYLFYPTHHAGGNGLAKWEENGRVIGYCREVANARHAWLMLHGNGGQAADRTYALRLFPREDSVFVLEYPGYGARSGLPSKDSFDAAARDAYRLMRRSFPAKPVCVAGESLGSGPACVLAGESPPPDKIVLAVPFDELSSVAAEHVPWVFAKVVLGSTWNNVRALAHYRGPVEIYGAAQDQVIPVAHARALAASVPQARFHLIGGAHNQWPAQAGVAFRYP